MIVILYITSFLF